MNRLTIGRIVHFCIGLDGAQKPVYRPAIVVQVWSDECANLRVFLDGPNDAHFPDAVEWVGSATFGDQCRQWIWPPREAPKASESIGGAVTGVLLALFVLGLMLPARAFAQGAAAATAASTLLPFFLHLALPVLGTLAGGAITWIVAREALGWGWLAAQSHNAKTQAKLQQLGVLMQASTGKILKDAWSDLVAGASPAKYLADVVADVKATITPDFMQDLGGLLELGAERLPDILKGLAAHHITLHPAVQAAAGKVLAVSAAQQNAVNAMPLDERRNLVASQGKVAL